MIGLTIFLIKDSGLIAFRAIQNKIIICDFILLVIDVKLQSLEKKNYKICGKWTKCIIAFIYFI